MQLQEMTTRGWLHEGTFYYRLQCWITQFHIKVSLCNIYGPSASLLHFLNACVSFICPPIWQKISIQALFCCSIWVMLEILYIYGVMSTVKKIPEFSFNFKLRWLFYELVSKFQHPWGVVEMFCFTSKS